MTPKRKITIVMEESVAYGMQDAVEKGFAKNQSALVQEAVTEFLKRVKDEWLRREYERAAKDPRFMKDIEEVMRDFRFVDAETWPDE